MSITAHDASKDTKIVIDIKTAIDTHTASNTAIDIKMNHDAGTAASTDTTATADNITADAFKQLYDKPDNQINYAFVRKILEENRNRLFSDLNAYSILLDSIQNHRNYFAERLIPIFQTTLTAEQRKRFGLQALFNTAVVTGNIRCSYLLYEAFFHKTDSELDMHGAIEFARKSFGFVEYVDDSTKIMGPYLALRALLDWLSSNEHILERDWEFKLKDQDRYLYYSLNRVRDTRPPIESPATLHAGTPYSFYSMRSFAKGSIGVAKFTKCNPDEGIILIGIKEPGDGPIIPFMHIEKTFQGPISSQIIIDDSNHMEFRAKVTIGEPLQAEGGGKLDLNLCKGPLDSEGYIHCGPHDIWDDVPRHRIKTQYHDSNAHKAVIEKIKRAANSLDYEFHHPDNNMGQIKRAAWTDWNQARSDLMRLPVQLGLKDLVEEGIAAGLPFQNTLDFAVDPDIIKLLLDSGAKIEGSTLERAIFYVRDREDKGFPTLKRLLSEPHLSQQAFEEGFSAMMNVLANDVWRPSYSNVEIKTPATESDLIEIFKLFLQCIQHNQENEYRGSRIFHIENNLYLALFHKAQKQGYHKLMLAVISEVRLNFNLSTNRTLDTWRIDSSSRHHYSIKEQDWDEAPIIPDNARETLTESSSQIARDLVHLGQHLQLEDGTIGSFLSKSFRTAIQTIDKTLSASSYVFSKSIQWLQGGDYLPKDTSSQKDPNEIAEYIKQKKEKEQDHSSPGNMLIFCATYNPPDQNDGWYRDPKQRAESVQHYLNIGADPDFDEGNGTALMLTQEKEVMELLLRAEASSKIVTKEGKTIWDSAIRDINKVITLIRWRVPIISGPNVNNPLKMAIATLNTSDSEEILESKLAIIMMMLSTRKIDAAILEEAFIRLASKLALGPTVLRILETFLECDHPFSLDVRGGSKFHNPFNGSLLAALLVKLICINEQSLDEILVKIINLLVEKGASVNLKDNAEHSPLSFVIENIETIHRKLDGFDIQPQMIDTKGEAEELEIEFLFMPMPSPTLKLVRTLLNSKTILPTTIQDAYAKISLVSSEDFKKQLQAIFEPYLPSITINAASDAKITADFKTESDIKTASDKKLIQDRTFKANQSKSISLAEQFLSFMNYLYITIRPINFYDAWHALRNDLDAHLSNKQLHYRAKIRYDLDKRYASDKEIDVRHIKLNLNDWKVVLFQERSFIQNNLERLNQTISPLIDYLANFAKFLMIRRNGFYKTDYTEYQASRLKEIFNAIKALLKQKKEPNAKWTHFDTQSIIWNLDHLYSDMAFERDREKETAEEKRLLEAKLALEKKQAEELKNKERLSKMKIAEEAIQKGDHEKFCSIAKELMAAGDINKPETSPGMTLLHFARAQKAWRAFVFLEKSGASLEECMVPGNPQTSVRQMIQDLFVSSPEQENLYKAAIEVFEKELVIENEKKKRELELAEAAKILEVMSSLRKIKLAAEKDNVDTLRKLVPGFLTKEKLDGNTNYNLNTFYQEPCTAYTIMHFAAQKGALKALLYLESQGGQMDLKSKTTNISKETPVSAFDILRKNGKYRAYKILSGKQEELLKEEWLEQDARIDQMATAAIDTVMRAARAEVAVETNQKLEEEARARAKAKVEAELAAKIKAEAQAKEEAIAKARAKAEALVKAQSEQKIKVLGELKARAIVKAKAIAEALAEAAAKAAAEAEAKAELAAKIKAEEEAKAKAQAEQQAKLEAELKAKVEADRLAQALAEAAAKAEAEAAAAKTKAEAQAKAEAERLAKFKAAEEEAKRAKEENDNLAKIQANLKAKAQAEMDVKAKLEADAAAHKSELLAKAKAQSRPYLSTSKRSLASTTKVTASQKAGSAISSRLAQLSKHRPKTKPTSTASNTTTGAAFASASAVSKAIKNSIINMSAETRHTRSLSANTKPKVNASSQPPVKPFTPRFNSKSLANPANMTNRPKTSAASATPSSTATAASTQTTSSKPKNIANNTKKSAAKPKPRISLVARQNKAAAGNTASASANPDSSGAPTLTAAYLAVFNKTNDAKKLTETLFTGNSIAASPTPPPSPPASI